MRAEDIKPGAVYQDAQVWLVISVESVDRLPHTIHIKFIEVPLTGPNAGLLRPSAFTFESIGEDRRDWSLVAEGG